MAHPDNEAVTNQAAKKSNILMTVVLFLIVVSIAFFAYLKSNNIDISKISLQQLISGKKAELKLLKDNINEVAYDSREHPVFSAYKDYIVKCNNDGIWFLDKKGREVWTLGIALTKPIVKTNGKYLLVADLGGRDVYVLDGKNVYWNDKTEMGILNAEINDNGYVTVVTESEYYNGEVRVYDNHGIELFQKGIANEFIVTAKIDSSQRQMVINLINPTGAKSNTYFKFYDMANMNSKELKKVEMPIDKGLFPLFWFAGGSSVYTAGNNSIIYMDMNGNIKWEKEYPVVDSACITGNKRVAAAVEDKDGLKLVVISPNGKGYSSTLLNNKALNINSSGRIIAVNTVREVDFFNERGGSIGKYVSKADIEYVLFFSSSQVAIVTKKNVIVVDI